MTDILSRLHAAQQRAIKEGVGSFTIDYIGKPDEKYIVTISGHDEEDAYTMTTTLHLGARFNSANAQKVKKVEDFVETVKKTPDNTNDTKEIKNPGFKLFKRH